ncbi:uncharacterized protein [Nicotiana sylvestris]|uniref:uncharacterized protein n=1 Tax=Nicotiana sylvestris TaxID=4096 RepID=UPI00388CD82E
MPSLNFAKIGIGTERIGHNNVCVRAFDFIKRDKIGEIDLILTIGPADFEVTFQVLDMDTSYNFLLGRPWVYAAGAVSSTLHQIVKFEHEDQEIVVHGEDEQSIYRDPSVPCLKAREGSEHIVYQAFQVVVIDQCEEGILCPQPFLSNASIMVIAEMIKHGYKPGKGLRASLQGITEIITLGTDEKFFGVCFHATETDVTVPMNERAMVLMDEEDAEKTAFTTPWGTYCYRDMSFGLKNAGATYMRDMTAIFHDMMHQGIEVYVGDVITKSRMQDDHVRDLRKFFERLRKYDLKLNPSKCAFGVPSGKLLRFIGEWETRDVKLIPYKKHVENLSKWFKSVGFRYIPHFHNELADALATLASMLPYLGNVHIDPLEIQIRERHGYCNVVEVEPNVQPWYHDIKRFLKTKEYPEQANGDQKRTIRRLANSFFLSGDVLNKKTPDLNLLRCVDSQEAGRIMHEVHAGVCGPHMNGYVLNSHLMREICEQFNITHRNSPYRPKANGAIEAANKNIKKILRKMIQSSRQWHKKLSFALLGYRTTVWTSVRATPYLLVYGTKAVIPAEVEIPSLRIIVEAEIKDSEWVKTRLEQLTLIDEKRMAAISEILGKTSSLWFSQARNNGLKLRGSFLGVLVGISAFQAFQGSSEDLQWSHILLVIESY